jgi:hypothetical protein
MPTLGSSTGVRKPGGRQSLQRPSPTGMLAAEPTGRVHGVSLEALPAPWFLALPSGLYVN